MTQWSEKQLTDAYRMMKTIREFEDRLHLEIQTGHIAGFTHLYAGQEAVAVGVCQQLNNDDYVASTHRGHGHCLAKGLDVVQTMKEIYGCADGVCGGKGGSMHMADMSIGLLGANAVVGASVPIALGSAVAARNAGKGQVAVSFNGDGGSNQGVVFESMNMAVILKAPLVFIYENNNYSEHTGADYGVGSKDASGRADIAGRAAAFGMPAVTVDGNDFFAVQKAAEEAIALARNGGGPSAIECRTNRFFGHFEGDPQRYRADGEVAELRENSDCLKFFRQSVSRDNMMNTADLDHVDTEVTALIDRAVAEAQSGQRPDPAQLHTDVYASY